MPNHISTTLEEKITKLPLQTPLWQKQKSHLVQKILLVQENIHEKKKTEMQ